MCVCLCRRRVEWRRWIGFSRRGGVIARSAGLFQQSKFSLEGSFLSSVFLLSDHFIFHLLFVWMQRTKCQECRKTYYCVVVQGMRWCFCFVSCHKWSILDVQFPFKTIESCSSGASTSGVDIFRGGSAFVLQPFPQLWKSVWEQTRECQSWGGFSDMLRVLFAYIRPSLTSEEDANRQFNPQTQNFSVTVMKCQRTGNTEQSFSSLGNPLFSGKYDFLHFVPPTPTTSCSSHYLSCLYMWKTEQQTAASISFSWTFLYFHSDSERLHVGHWQRGQRRVQRCVFSSCSDQVTNQSTRGGVSPDDDNNTRAVFWHVTSYCGSLSNCFCQKGFSFPSYRKDVWTPKLSSEVCVCSSTQCVCLIALRPWLVAVLT